MEAYLINCFDLSPLDGSLMASFGFESFTKDFLLIVGDTKETKPKASDR